MSPDLQVQEKKELVEREERTVPAKYYVPLADIHETEAVLSVVLEMPGVEKKNVSVQLEKDVLQVEGKIDFSNYQGLDAIYTEYNVGHYARSFHVSNVIDQSAIGATMDEGVLTLTLPKKKEAQPRKIEIG